VQWYVVLGKKFQGDWSIVLQYWWT